MLIKPLSEEALLVKIDEKGAKINVESQVAISGEILLSSAAFLLNRPM